MSQQVEIFNVNFDETFQSIAKLKPELKEIRKLFEQAKPGTEEFIKYGTEVKRLDGSIKQLNSITKEQTNALGGINTAAKFTAGSYGELKQRIDAQKKALNGLTIGTDEFNATLQGLNKLQEERIAIEKDIPSLFKERIKGAIDESNALKNLRAELKAANAAALNGDGKAAQRAAELRDQLEDLKDTTNSLKGSGVERLNTSVNLLSQGFADFDTDKIKTGFKGISAAMSAIPIVLIIEGVKALIDNFDKVVEVVKNLTGGFSASVIAIKELTKETEKDTIVNNALIASYDNEIALLTAKGGHEKEITELKKKKIAVEILEAENSVRLNAAKAAEIILNDNITESLQRIYTAYLRKTGQDNLANVYEKAILIEKKERAKEEVDAIREAQQQIADAKNSLLVLDAENARKSNETAKANNKKRKELDAELAAILKEETDKVYSDKKKAEEKALRLSVENQKKADDQVLELDKQLLENLRLLDEQTLQDQITNAQINLINVQNQGGDLLAARLELLNAEREQELSNTELTQSERALIINQYREKEKAAQLQTNNDLLQSAQYYTSSVGDLSNALFDLKRSNLQKGSEEDKAAAKKQFDTNKAVSIATAVLNGAAAVMNALGTVEPFYLAIAASVGAVATTAAQVAKISATQFQYFDGGFTKQGDPTQKAESIGNAQFHNDEYVVPSKVKNNPAAVPHINILEKMRKGGVNSISKISGFFDGGFTARSASSQSVINANTQSNIIDIMSKMKPPVLIISELNKANNSNKAAVNVSSLG